METNLKEENERAHRIGFMTNNFHDDITFIYEGLVDKEYPSVIEKVKSLMVELRYVIKLAEQDDF
jgi:hypothetical protein